MLICAYIPTSRGDTDCDAELAYRSAVRCDLGQEGHQVYKLAGMLASDSTSIVSCTPGVIACETVHELE